MRPGKARSLTVARGVGDEAGAVAVVDAAVVVQELAGVARGAVLAMLAGAVLADLAVGNGGVVLGGALAAVVDRRVDDEPGRPAEERLGAAAFELTDAGRRELSRARIDTVTVQQIPAIAALRRRSEAPTATIEKARTAVQCVTMPGTLRRSRVGHE